MNVRANSSVHKIMASTRALEAWVDLEFRFTVKRNPSHVLFGQT